LTVSTTPSPVLLASDFPILRDSLKAHFKNTPEIELVACANEQSEIIPLLLACQPKLVLLDLNIEWDALCTLLDKIHANREVRSLVMSDSLESQRVIQALRHGANGVVPRRVSQELFTKSITAVLAGDFWVSRAMVPDFVDMIRKNGSGSPGENGQGYSESAPEVDISRFGLTPRELQIIGALVDGQTNKDIGNTFGISEYTVKHHLTNIYDKLGVYNRVELVLFAINHRISTAPGAVIPQDAR
jgi:two-component system nitrate/nitrite response regulator NarL